MEAELNDELRFHAELEMQKLIGRGVEPREAARQARLAFGMTELVKEECRDERGTAWIENLGRDIGFAARMLRKNPTFTAVALLSLAMGIGANTAIFQLMDAVRLRDLPVKDPRALYEVVLGGDGPSGNFTSRYSTLSYAQWEQIEAQQQAFSSIGAWSARRFNLASGGEIRPAEGMMVTGRFFETLGIPAARGRLLGPADDLPGCAAPAVVISDAFWKREFGGAADAVGRTLKVDGHITTVVGITPEQFFGVDVGRSYDLAIPLCTEALLRGADSQLTVNRDNYWLSAIGRLRPGWTAQRADAQLRAISKSVFTASLPDGMDAERRNRYEALWLHSAPAGKGFSWLRVNYEKPLWLLLGSAALVLLVACGNLANLLLARASSRSRELAVRVALGASRGRLVQQLLTEDVLLAVLGAALGLLVARAVSRALVAFLDTTDDPVAISLRLDWRVLSFCMAMGLCTCLLFGLAPAIWASRVKATSAFARTRQGPASRGASAFRRFLVATQVALSLVLVAGAALFGTSLFHLLASDIGFRPERVLIMSLDTRRLGLSEERQRPLFDSILVRLRQRPEVLGAAEATIIPMSGWESSTMLVRADGQSMRTRFSPVSSGYFSTLGAPLLAGRDFAAEGGPEDEQVAIVNEAFIRTFYRGSHALGQTFTWPLAKKKLWRIVGVVKNTKYRALNEDFTPIAFFPANKVPFAPNYVRYVIRARTPDTELTRALRSVVAGVSPAIDIEFASLHQELRDSVMRERLLAALAGGFGLLAGFLSAVGLYGVLSYSVAMRRNEIGIRMALGANRASVMRVVLREAGWLLAAGTAAGLVATLSLGRMAASLLYQVEPWDPWTLLAAVAALLLAGMASSYLPARNAARLDPLIALRQE